MNTQSFYSGVGAAIEKRGLLPELFTRGYFSARDALRNNIMEPAVRGVSDKNYDGLVRFDPTSGEYYGDTANTANKVFGSEQTEHTPYQSWIKNKVYDFGQSPLGKQVAEYLHGGQEGIGNEVSEKSNGLFTMGDGGKLDVNRNRVLPMMWDKARSWMGANPGLTLGIGAGATALGLGLFGGRKDKPRQPVMPPNTAMPAPYAGREGNTFAQYQPV